MISSVSGRYLAKRLLDCFHTAQTHPSGGVDVPFGGYDLWPNCRPLIFRSSLTLIFYLFFNLELWSHLASVLGLLGSRLIHVPHQTQTSTKCCLIVGPPAYDVLFQRYTSIGLTSPGRQSLREIWTAIISCLLNPSTSTRSLYQPGEIFIDYIMDEVVSSRISARPSCILQRGMNRGRLQLERADVRDNTTLAMTLSFSSHTSIENWRIPIS